MNINKGCKFIHDDSNPMKGLTEAQVADLTMFEKAKFIKSVTQIGKACKHKLECFAPYCPYEHETESKYSWKADAILK